MAGVEERGRGKGNMENNARGVISAGVAARSLKKTAATAHEKNRCPLHNEKRKTTSSTT
jgi:hypothetical protein